MLLHCYYKKGEMDRSDKLTADPDIYTDSMAH